MSPIVERRGEGNGFERKAALSPAVLLTESGVMSPALHAPTSPTILAAYAHRRAPLAESSHLRLPLTILVERTRAFVDFFGSVVEEDGAFVERDGAFIDFVGSFVERDGAFVEDGGAFVENGGAFLDRRAAVFEGRKERSEIDSDTFPAGVGRHLEGRGGKEERPGRAASLLGVDARPLEKGGHGVVSSSVEPSRRAAAMFRNRGEALAGIGNSFARREKLGRGKHRAEW